MGGIIRTLGKALTGAAEVAVPAAMEAERNRVLQKREEMLRKWSKEDRAEEQAYQDKRDQVNYNQTMARYAVQREHDDRTRREDQNYRQQELSAKMAADLQAEDRAAARGGGEKTQTEILKKYDNYGNVIGETMIERGADGWREVTPSGGQQGQQSAPSGPPQAAIDLLQQDYSPESRAEFDEVFGAGASERYAPAGRASDEPGQADQADSQEQRRNSGVEQVASMVRGSEGVSRQDVSEMRQLMRGGDRQALFERIKEITSRPGISESDIPREFFDFLKNRSGTESRNNINGLSRGPVLGGGGILSSRM